MKWINMYIKLKLMTKNKKKKKHNGETPRMISAFVKEIWLFNIFNIICGPEDESILQ